PNDNQEINILTNEYQARMVCVDDPYFLPMYSGSVLTLAAKYRGANTTASRKRKTNAYQSKLTATMPVAYPTLAKASNIDGPTFVAHMLKPILGQPNDFPAKNNDVSVAGLRRKPARKPRNSNTAR